VDARRPLDELQHRHDLTAQPRRHERRPDLHPGDFIPSAWRSPRSHLLDGHRQARSVAPASTARMSTSDSSPAPSSTAVAVDGAHLLVELRGGPWACRHRPGQGQAFIAPPMGRAG
jgi:hypothetical protein